MRRDLDRVRDILEAIKRIESKMGSERAAFEDDEMLQIWVLHYLQIIGEAVNRLDEDMRRRFPEAPWRAIIGLRHVLVHQYFDIDLDMIWKVAAEELPALKAQVRKILEEMQD